MPRLRLSIKIKCIKGITVVGGNQLDLAPHLGYTEELDPDTFIGGAGL